MTFSTEMRGSFCCQAWEYEILFAPPVMLDTPNDAQSGRWLEADGSPWEDLELHSLGICVPLTQHCPLSSQSCCVPQRAEGS